MVSLGSDPNVTRKFSTQLTCNSYADYCRYWEIIV